MRMGGAGGRFPFTNRLRLRGARANGTIASAPMKGNKLTLWPLIAAVYLMVAGGPFGLEDTVSQMGYQGAILILLITPVIWALPAALMVAELASALPEEGGYYVWARRAMGPFGG